MVIFFIVAIILLAIVLLDFNYIYSFGFALLSSLSIMYSSYINILKKVHSAINNINLIDTKKNFLSKKEKFLFGFSISFALLRLVCYTFTIFGIIILINANMFFIIPFFIGVTVSVVLIILFVRFKEH